MCRPSRAGRFPSPQVLSLSLVLLSLISLPSALSWRPWPTPQGRGATNLTDSKKYEGSSEFVRLRYHMGPVLTANVTVHVIWYGRWAPRQKRILRSFLRSISSSSGPAKEPSVAGWWRTVRLYTDQTGSNVTRTVHLGREKTDRRYSLGRRLSRMSVQSIIKGAISARTRPLPINPRGGMYLVLTSDDVTMEDFCGQLVCRHVKANSCLSCGLVVCGFHYFTFPSIVGYTMPYAWVGNSATQCPGICAYPFAVPYYVGNPPRVPEAPPNGDVGVDGMVSVIGHELAEVASNPLINAWYAGGDPCFPQEIADLCEGIYGTGGGGSYTGQMLVDERSGAAYNVNGVGGRKFLVQWIWNPVVSYCSGPNALDQ
ncbi:putative protein EXORDIUM-like 3 [Iris pallida]|uniref:Uncharacterized protein n=1 Tax=Iris pallida TaxID=29817 RepID=A0AAX6H8D7_IRIPA|nr:putative protein EXORDIUM-like 3 [Iris pallida]